MAKGFDPEILAKTALSISEDMFTTGAKLAFTDTPTTKSQNIIEYQGRMGVTAMEKFNGPTYISSVSFYLNEQDRDKHKAKGALVLYLETSNADKILRGFGHPVADDEDGDETLNSCGKLCVAFAEKIKEALAAKGAPSLVLSAPISDKNSLYEGVEFSADQTEKQEISFYFFKKKAVVLDLTMAAIASR